MSGPVWSSRIESFELASGLSGFAFRQPPVPFSPLLVRLRKKNSFSPFPPSKKKMGGIYEFPWDNVYTCICFVSFSSSSLLLSVPIFFFPQFPYIYIYICTWILIISVSHSLRILFSFAPIYPSLSTSLSLLRTREPPLSLPPSHSLLSSEKKRKENG